jgi:hypothetical protein
MTAFLALSILFLRQLGIDEEVSRCTPLGLQAKVVFPYVRGMKHPDDAVSKGSILAILYRYFVISWQISIQV